MTEAMTESKSDAGSHAVVIGGSLGGLLSGLVLRKHFDRVTIFERDAVSDDPEPRKGVPQGRHVHTLFGGGADVVERLLPGFGQELISAGARKHDFGEGIKWYHQGVWKLRADIGLPSYWMSRPLLDSSIRRRVKDVAGIRICDQVDVTGLVANDDNTRVTGVSVTHRADGDRVEEIDAALVVDAGGRGSRLPGWLESLGYARPTESLVEIDLKHASRIMEPPQDRPDWGTLAVYGHAPASKRTGYIFPIEGDRWLASCVGFLGDHPTDDDAGWLEFARSLDQPDFFDAVSSAKPLTPISTFVFPANQRRHYERMSRFPDGLLALGDAVCAFNPVYGQGMSACALQVAELENTLQSGPSAAGLARGFFRRTAKINDDPWLLATSADFLYPETRGRRPFGTGLLLWYLVKVLELSGSNRMVLKTFHEVLHFYKTPTALFHPAIAFQVLKRSIGLGKSRNTDKS
jgi:2-polyprenyl-6-methoxyphenol hydroxylase-like FAD-dependent oxidoreductase